jgi:hexokinase
MSDVSLALNQLHMDFSVTTGELRTVANAFLRDMTAGLVGSPSSLAMLPSYLTRPSGQETGIFLALDFGGTNVRALEVELLGGGNYKVLRRQALPLVDPVNNYNFITESATADDLFDFLASQLAKLTNHEGTYLLGHTFSFPCRQIGVNDAILLHWTKEIKTSGVEGRNVVQLLNEALARRGLAHIRPVAILNDSVSALIASAYRDIRTDIGSICGTGHNTCYLEPNPPTGSLPMYINMESGNFDKVRGNLYDALLDNNSDKPGTGRLEKMCSGRYIGELFRLVTLRLADQGFLCSGHIPSFLSSSDSLTGEDIAILSSDASPDLEQIALWLRKYSFIDNCSYADRLLLQNIASCITRRSARLVAATYVGVLNHIDLEMSRSHNISIDGSLYEKMPGYAQTIQATISELLGDKANRVLFKSTKDGSGIGAAVAAATISYQC